MKKIHTRLSTNVTVKLCVFFQVKDDKIFTFPDDFLWGAATAAYQIEGADPWKNG